MGQLNLRVYGILINEQNQLLVTDELIRGMRITKFPGGGLEFGEGTRNCLAREFMEEMNLKVEVLEHLYTTDFFQESAFRPGDQIISIYYKVRALEPIKVRISTTPFDFDADQMKLYEERRETESFRFIDWAELSDECLTLPIDKLVVRQIIDHSR
ncbi:NUDIX domain-containing protein [Cnuella takakiae]|uniref:NUDIX domain-containing protein n=1 Tax=Cnuella takakiae TaxID=1302690 RepID=A0A1M4VAY8_9BACT|nr:NUDIX domain-containing protein [Cnuella takakiae]OLY92654.1 NUDIX hydrolase [Cnuella takakiae]SHE66050.1 NUDIX domain-containing protein [Cnuella takakiae]